MYILYRYVDGFDEKSPSSFIDGITKQSNNNCKYVELHETEDTQNNLYKYCTVHIDIHSFLAKLDVLKNIIYTLSAKKVIKDFILLCETFLNYNNSQLRRIDGYELICNNRGNGKVEVWQYSYTKNCPRNKERIWR